MGEQLQINCRCGEIYTFRTQTAMEGAFTECPFCHTWWRIINGYPIPFFFDEDHDLNWPPGK